MIYLQKKCTACTENSLFKQMQQLKQVHTIELVFHKHYKSILLTANRFLSALCFRKAAGQLNRNLLMAPHFYWLLT